MKHLKLNLSLFTLVALLATSFSLRAQVAVVNMPAETPPPTVQHEVRFNLLTPIVFRGVQMDYERLLKGDFGVGGYAQVAFDKVLTSFFPQATIAPYGRWYFGGKKLSFSRPHAGLYLEASTALNIYRDNYTYVSKYEKIRQSDKRTAMGWGFGAGIGWKYVSRGNWSADLGVRVGRNLVGSNGHSGDFYATYLVSVGKRF